MNPDEMEDKMATAWGNSIPISGACGDDYRDALGYAQSAMSQQQARQLAQQQAELANSPVFHTTVGSSAGALGSTDTTGEHNITWTAGTTDTTELDDRYYVYNGLTQAVDKVKKQLLRFFRVNKIVEVDEEKLDDPLDELRIKVARWLNPKERYNFA